MSRKSSLNPAARSENSENEPQLKFLFAAMQDTQAVIRATDSKVIALMAGLLVPLTKLSAIWAICAEFLHRLVGFGGFLAGLLVLIFALSWTISFAATIRTLFHVDDPSKHVDGDKPTGCFYASWLYKVSLRDVFTPQRLDSVAQFNEFFNQLPANEESVRRELTFEFMKLVYIRTVKLARVGVAYTGFVIWFICGGSIWIATLFLRTHGS